MYLGRHALADLYSCTLNISDNDKLKRIILDSIKEAKLTAVEVKFHEFDPIGLSGVIILAESHLTIHTWPEYDFVSIDAFTCGTKMDPTLVCNIIAKKLKCSKLEIKEIKRGIINE